jgi:GNAT superfamily N-acetyltransferase
MDLRSFAENDLEACEAVFDSQDDTCFGPAERKAFTEFLESRSCPYFVMDHEGSIVGCGGYLINAPAGEAALVWGMIRKDSQRMGLGRFLLLFRLKEIGKQENISVVRAETSQKAALFFQKQVQSHGCSVQRSRLGTEANRIT